MGYFYEIGMYVSIDLRESEIWYLKAAEHGNKDALGRVDSIKKNNTLSKKDHEQVAISRIKSQYGSQRGGRPERFKQKPAPMSPMVEERTEMPEPRNSYAGPAVDPLNPRRVSPSGRPVSTAPYPEDDVAPMPGAFNGGLRPSPGSGPQADRPLSAFGIRPLHQSSTETTNQGLRPQEPMRPSTSQGNIAVPAGRGNNPAERGRVVSAGWEPQAPSRYSDHSPGARPSLPRLNMGPPPPTNYDQGSNRLQKPIPSPNMNKPQPSPGYPVDPYDKPPPQPGYNSPVQRRNPAANQFTRPERGSSMTPTINQQRPERFDSMQPQNPSRASQRPPQQTTSSQGSGPRPTSAAPPATSNPSPAPPKKQGPSTFEEMGIPTGKQDSDCVSSAVPSPTIALLTKNRLLCDSLQNRLQLLGKGNMHVGLWHQRALLEFRVVYDGTKTMIMDGMSNGR
jgi:hypothetical protein